MQSNHFEQPGISLTASVAIIPWNGFSFRGQIVGLWHGGRLYRFATYTGARIERLALDGGQVHWVLRGRVGGRPHRLEIRAWRAEGGSLRGPSPSDMGVRVPETLSARIDVRLSRLPGRVAAGRGRRAETLYEGTGRTAGLEVVGDLERLLNA
jgi:hypothetical protein